MTYSNYTYIESFELEFNDSEWYEHDDESIAKLDFNEVTDFNFESEYSELDEVLREVIDNSIFSENCKLNQLSTFYDAIGNMNIEQVKQLLAYHEEYTLTSIQEVIDLDTVSIVVLDYESDEEYIKEQTIEQYNLDPNLVKFIDWSGYAEYTGQNWQVLELDSEKFIYTLT